MARKVEGRLLMRLHRLPGAAGGALLSLRLLLLRKTSVDNQAAYEDAAWESNV